MFHLLLGVDAWWQRWLHYPTGQAQGIRHTNYRAQCEQRERHQEKQNPVWEFFFKRNAMIKLDSEEVEVMKTANGIYKVDRNAAPFLKLSPALI